MGHTKKHNTCKNTSKQSFKIHEDFRKTAKTVYTHNTDFLDIIGTFLTEA